MADQSRHEVSTCIACNRRRDLIAVERLKTRTYVLRIFRCASCGSVLRMVGPYGIETDGDYRRRQAALRRARMAARQPQGSSSDWLKDKSID